MTLKECRFPNILRWMRHNGVTQDQFAKLGISASSLSYTLRGMTDPKLYTIRAVIRVTGMTYEEALNEGTANDSG